MNKVMKQSFYEASIRVDEEFDNAEIAAKSNRPSENASINILDLKLEVSKVKSNGETWIRKRYWN